MLHPFSPPSRHLPALILCLLFAFLCLTFQALGQAIPTGTQRATPAQATSATISPPELLLWQSRLSAGPYRLPGDAITNSPPDAATIRTFANAFRANPIVFGNTNAESTTIWTGYSTNIYTLTNPQIEALNQSPDWQGVKALCAAFIFATSGDTSYGNPVVRAIRAQLAVGGNSNLANWPLTTAYEAGFPEAKLYQRIELAYDYVRTLVPFPERQQWEGNFTASSTYLCNRQTLGRIGQALPNRLSADYTVLRQDAAPGGWPALDPTNPIYGTPDRYQNWTGDNTMRTHRNLNGTLGNRISRLAEHYNNRQADKMYMVALTSIITGNQFLQSYATTFFTEWVAFSSYPDGTLGEWGQRGNYYDVPAQGLHYSMIAVQAYLLFAQFLANQGDSSLANYSTSFTIHATPGTRSIRRICQRIATCHLAINPIFIGTTSTLPNRLDFTIKPRGVQKSTKRAPWTYLLHTAHRLFPSDTLLWAAENDITRGATPYPAAGYTTAESVFYCWGGTSAQLPAYHLMYARTSSIAPEMVPPLTITRLTVVDATADADWQRLLPGTAINLTTLPAINLRASTVPSTVGSVQYTLTRLQPAVREVITTNTPPYALRGSSGQDFAAWSPAPGSYTLTAQAFSGPNATGTRGTPTSLPFQIRQNIPQP